MIVRDAASDLLVITQPDHAALAGRLMAAWRADGLPARPTRAVALHATTHHDEGWLEEDARPLVDPVSGRPYDFIGLPLARRQAVWPRGIERVAATSTYVAALVAQHALTIHRRYRADAAWATFFAEMERARDHWFTTGVRPDGSAGGPLDVPLAERTTFLQDYTVVRMGDLLSLVFCNGWTTPEELEGYAIWMHDDALTVCPDPFDGAAIRFDVPARRIPAVPYASDAALRDALAGAAFETLTGRMVGVVPRSA